MILIFTLMAKFEPINLTINVPSKVKTARYNRRIKSINDDYNFKHITRKGEQDCD
jgi:hypothetical protein